MGGTSSGASTSSSGASSGTSGGLSSSCPAAAPATGEACSVDQLQCEYGADPSVTCNTVATCATGKWNLRKPQPNACPSKPPPAECPATRDGVTVGATCAPEGLSCPFASGQCVCRRECGPRYPVERPCDASTPFTWHCAVPAAECPRERPRVGAACTTAELTCSYGEDPCVSPSFRCTDGTWREVRVECPISSARYKSEIAYLEDRDLERVAAETRSMRLATWRYSSGGDARHFGFVIEDAPGVAAVGRSGDHVDLYGYTSMAVATVQVQAKHIDALERDLASLRREVREMREAQARCSRSRAPSPNK